MKKIRNQNGVTLVALIVTIIVLVILAGISINLVLGDNGIVTIAKKAKKNTELAKIEEETNLNELYIQLTSEDFSLENSYYDSINGPFISKIITNAYTNRTWSYCRYDCTLVIKVNNAKSFTLNEVNPSTILSVTGATYSELTFYPTENEVTIVFEQGEGNNNSFGGSYYITSYT